MSIIYISSDHTVTLTGLSGGGSYLNAATVTYALKDLAGTTVSGGTGTLSYTAASNGNYTGIIDATVTALLTDGGMYYVHATIVEGGYNDFRKLMLIAKYRDAS